MRKLPKTLRDCLPGDVVVLPEIGKIVVTGNNMGKAESHRFVRPLDENDKEGEIMPLPTSIVLAKVINLRM